MTATANTITAFHGTAAEFAGTPTIQTDVYGFRGIFLTESFEDAEYFASMNTEGGNDGEERVFTATVDLTDALDLTDLDGDQDEIVAAYLATDAPVYILPDMSGVSEREILVADYSVIAWV